MVGAFGLLAVALSAISPHLGTGGPSYAEWLTSLPNDPVARIQWFLGDITEPQFYKSWTASLGLLLGAAIAWWAGARCKRWAGTPISYGSGLWPWILGSAALSLLLSNVAFGWLLDEGWQPTFVPFVCVATSVVLVYGRGWPVFFTGALLGVLTTPVAMLLIEFVTGPPGLPDVVANTAAMSIGAAMAFVVSRYLPWMKRPVPQAQTDDDQGPADVADVPGRSPTVRTDAVWMIRRVLTDFTETQFYANELASLGVILGVVLAVLLNPMFPSYGTELLPHILFAQALTSTIGIIVWRHLYRGGGWAPTYISVVSVAPATVLAYNGSMLSIALGAAAGALLCPVIARPISQRLPADFHPFIGNTISMAVSTSLIVPAVGLLT